MTKTPESVVKSLLTGMDLIEVSVPGKAAPVKCVTITQLAALCGRRPGSLRTLEKKGKIPDAPYRLPGPTTNTGIDTSQRLYPVVLAGDFAIAFRTYVTQGKTITPELTAKFHKIFKHYAGTD
jgi:hypothetical protein